LLRGGRRVGVGLGPGVKVGGIGITRVLVGVGGRGVQVAGTVGVMDTVGLATTALGGAGVGSSRTPQPGVAPKPSSAARMINKRRAIPILPVWIENK
jgi:hypothetical protein